MKAHNGLRWLGLLAIASLTLSGCPNKLSGPKPTIAAGGVSRVVPPVERGEKNAIGLCRDNILEIKGSNFSPLGRDLAKKGRYVEMPKIELVHSDGDLNHVILITQENSAWLDKQTMQAKLPFCKDGTGSGEGVCQDPLLPWEEDTPNEPTDSQYPFGDYTVRVTNPNGNAAALDKGLLIVKPPRLQSIDTGEDPKNTMACSDPDMTIDLLGKYFRSEVKVSVFDKNNDERFSGVDGTTGSGVTRADSTKITITIPQSVQLQIGDYTLNVDNPEECESELKDGLHVIAPPLALAPNIVCVDIDTVVALNGADYRQGAKVRLNGNDYPADKVTYVSEDKYEIFVPANSLALGSYDVELYFFDGCSASVKAGLQVIPTPTITEVVPAEVCVDSNTHVVIKGTGFSSDTKVTVGTATDIVPDAVSPDGTSIDVTVPGDTFTLDDLLDVTVTTAAGCSVTKEKAVKVVTGPIVAVVDPDKVYNGVNFPVSIFGSGFDAKSKVTIFDAGGNPTELSITTIEVDFRIDAVVPQGLTPGVYDVQVTDGKGCMYNLKGSLTITDQLTVRICGVDPPFGWTGTTTPVTILSGTGTGCSQGTEQFVSTPRAWLSINNNLRPIRSVAFITPTSLSGTVPDGYDVGGPYDVLVQNPDGQIGLLAKAFTVAEKPVPQIASINPASVDTQFNNTLTIAGGNFRSPIKVELIAADGTTTPLTNPTVNSETSASATLNVGGLGIGVGAYVVRVTNTDEGTYTDFSALAITNPSNNLSGFLNETLPKLSTPRSKLGLVSGQVSAAARFLYAIGGADSGGAPLDTIEVGSLDKFGVLGGWLTQRYKLNTPRVGPGVVQYKGFIWVLGGLDNGGNPLNTVERAKIQRLEDAPQIATFTFTPKGQLEKGAYIYRVSATMPNDHPTNPSGETLPSDFIVVKVVDNSTVTLTWNAPPDATSYNITYNVYRTPVANGTLGEEVLLEGGLPKTTTVYKDDGTRSTGTQKPLKQGETGVFVSSTHPAVPTLAVARGGVGAQVGNDPNGDTFIWVTGGQGTGGALDTYEVAKLTDGGRVLGNFSEDTTNKLGDKRAYNYLVVADSTTNSKIAPNTTFLYVVGGADGNNNVDSLVVATVQVGGKTGAWTNPYSSWKFGRRGQVAYLRHNGIFIFGGVANSGPSTECYNGSLTTPPTFQSISNLASGKLAVGRAFMGLAIDTAFMYLVGGTSSGTDVLDTTLRQVY